MSENTAPARCSEADWRLASQAGLPFFTTADEIAIGKFATAVRAELLDALSELADLMDAVKAGSYAPDSFTTQPARALLAKFITEGSTSK